LKLSGEFGKVEYFVQVIIKRALFKFDFEEIVPFLVNSILDLRLEPTAMVSYFCFLARFKTTSFFYCGCQTSVARSDRKYLCCFCCQTGPITAQVMIPKTGYVPGEVININAKIQNNSAARISSTSAKLLQVKKSIGFFYLITKLRSFFKVARKFV